MGGLIQKGGEALAFQSCRSSYPQCNLVGGLCVSSGEIDVPRCRYDQPREALTVSSTCSLWRSTAVASVAVGRAVASLFSSAFRLLCFDSESDVLRQGVHFGFFGFWSCFGFLGSGHTAILFK